MSRWSNMQPGKPQFRQNGFTLVEIAVVLVIVGLLIGSFIGTFASRIDITRRDQAHTELGEIRRVLIAYAFSQPNVHLPCPDVSSPPDGLQDRTPPIYGICDAGNNVGTLPWQDLGLGVSDAWSTHYRYWVSSDYSWYSGFDLSSDDGEVGTSNAAIQTRSGNVPVNIVSNAVAVVFSHGPNTLGGTSVEGVVQPAIPASGHNDENENIDVDAIFMSRPPTEEGASATGGVFDDIVIWINSYEIKAKMVEAGKLP